MSSEHTEDFNLLDDTHSHPGAFPGEPTPLDHPTQIHVDPAPAELEPLESTTSGDASLSPHADLASEAILGDAVSGPFSQTAPDGSELDGTPAQDTQYW